MKRLVVAAAVALSFAVPRAARAPVSPGGAPVA